MFRIGGNTFYDRKNKIPKKIPEFKRSGIGSIAEFGGIPNGFPNQVAGMPWIGKVHLHAASLTAWVLSLLWHSYQVLRMYVPEVASQHPT